MQNFLPRDLINLVRTYVSIPKKDFDIVMMELTSPVYIYDNVMKQLANPLSSARHTQILLRRISYADLETPGIFC